MKNFLKKGNWKTTRYQVLTLLIDKIDIIKELNIFGLDLCFNNYNFMYSKNNKPIGHDMVELSLFK